MDEDVEVAAGPLRTPASPSPATRMRVPSSTPAGMFTDQLAPLERAALAFAAMAGVGDDFAAAAAGRAAALDHEEALLRADLARPPQVSQVSRNPRCWCSRGRCNCRTGAIASIEIVVLGAGEGVFEATVQGRSEGPRRAPAFWRPPARSVNSPKIDEKMSEKPSKPAPPPNGSPPPPFWNAALPKRS